MGKPWWQSKTLWFNALSLIATAVTAIAGHEIVADYPSVVLVMMGFQAVINGVLRWITNEPIEVK